MTENNKKDVESREALIGLNHQPDLFSGINHYFKDVVVILDFQGRIIYGNRNCERITGLSLDKVRGRYYREVFISPAGNKSPEGLPEHFKPGEEVEEEIKGQGGNNYFIQWKCGLLTEEEGGTGYLVLAGTDLTMQKKMEKALQEIKTLGKNKMQSRHVVVYLDTSLRVVSCNGPVEALLGWSKQEIQGREVTLFLEEENGTVKECCLKTIQGETFNGLELSCFRKDGGNADISITLAPLRDNEKKDKISGLVLEVYDNNERKQIDSQLNRVVHDNNLLLSGKDMQEMEKEAEKYREILSTIEEGYYEVDLKGNFVLFNDSLCRMLGYSREELLYENYKKLYRNPEEVYKAYNRVYRTGQPEKMVEWSLYTKDGRKIFVEVSISLRWDEEGNPIGFRGVARDITERRKVEEEVQYLSIHDSLTGLYNRGFMEKEMWRLDRLEKAPVSVIMADLNGLKLVNDSYGHRMGDKMLKYAAEVLQSSCRKDDIIARWGGDEFAIIFPNLGENEVDKVYQRINENFQEAYIENIPVSMALGLAIKDSADKKMTEVLKEAEDDMYRRKLAESRSMRSAVLEAFIKTLEEKSFETEAHTKRMQNIALKIGRRLGLSDSELNRLNLVIRLHDIGKINIPEEILTKPGPLTEEEWEIIKKHPEVGYRITRATEEFAHVAKDVQAHHEKWDGSGYPQGLRGSEIPLLARITSIVDAYEVMSNGRPYKNPMRREDIIAEFKKCSGSQFDPELVEIFLYILEHEGVN